MTSGDPRASVFIGCLGLREGRCGGGEAVVLERGTGFSEGRLRSDGLLLRSAVRRRFLDDGRVKASVFKAKRQRSVVRSRSVN